MRQTQRIIPTDIWEIAAESVADPRSVRKVLRGEWVSRGVGERIRRTIERRGIRPRQNATEETPK